MNTIGLFTGCGDVVLSMLIAAVGCVWVGYKLNDLVA